MPDTRRCIVEANVRDLVVEYVSAAGDKRFDRLEELVHPDATMDGTCLLYTSPSPRDS